MQNNSLLSEHDPMGQAIYDFCFMNEANRLRVDSSITEDEEIDVTYLFRDFNDMPDLEQKALQSCKGNVLDVGAGAGSHSLWLEENGLKVSSIDISDLSVQVMKQRGLQNATVADFFELKGQQFDTLLFLMNGVGIAGNLFGLDKLLVKCKQLLNNGGQVLLDSSDIIYMFDEGDNYSTDTGEYYGELQYQMTYKKIVGKPFNWLYIGDDLLQQYASKHGFTCEILQKGEHYDYLARLELI